MQKFVSIIIPTYKDWHRLKLCIDALSEQSYPQDRFEVIVVNNDPNDSCPYLLPSDNMRVIMESKPGSYAARNAGVRVAKGDVLAFTDSDCIPDPFWIENGLVCFEKNVADLVGGHVDFIFKNPGSAAEILDTIGNMNNHIRIPRHNCAATANLCVKKAVFDVVGLFDGSMKSGGDTVFTQRAVSFGFKLAYCAHAIVNHPTRNFKQGLIKSFRVGSGLLDVERKRPVSGKIKAIIILKHLFPFANPFSIWRTMIKFGYSSWLLFVKMMMMEFIFKLSKYFGIVSSFHKLFQGKEVGHE